MCIPALAQPGNALAFDGSNDYVEAGDNGSLDFGTGDFTVEYWILKPATGAFYGGVGKWNTGASPGTNEWILNLNTGGNNRPLFGIESGNTGYYVVGTTNLTSGQWYHIAGVRQGSAIKIYVNGLLEATTSTGAVVAVNNIGRTLMLGRLLSGNYSDHILDEVRIWNVARTAAELQAARYYSIDPATTGLKAYYKFEQGTGGANNAGVTTLPDLTGSGNNGTLIGFALSGTNSNWITSTAPINAFLLPLRAISVRATRGATWAQVDWKAIGAEDMLYYEVERASGASLNFTIVGRVPAESGTRTNYSWKDEWPLSGDAYYRIRATDARGRVQYSPLVQAAMGKQTGALSVYPNPVKGRMANLRLSGEAGTYRLLWYTAAGLMVESTKVRHDGGDWTYPLSTGGLGATGLYFLEVSTGNGDPVRIPVLKQ